MLSTGSYPPARLPSVQPVEWLVLSRGCPRQNNSELDFSRRTKLLQSTRANIGSVFMDGINHNAPDLELCPVADGDWIVCRVFRHQKGAL